MHDLNLTGESLQVMHWRGRASEGHCINYVDVYNYYYRSCILMLCNTTVLCFDVFFSLFFSGSISFGKI